MRCKNDAEKMAEVLVSVKKSFEKSLLKVWCDLEWDVKVEDVTDEFILAKIDEIIASVKNNSVPDVAALFKENVEMNLGEGDVKERVMQFFAKSREFVEEQGWQAFFTGKEGTRLRCKLLVESLEPRSLRDEIAMTVKYQARTAKEDEKELFKLILAKALEQDRDFQRRKRTRSKTPNDQKRKANTNDNEPFQSKQKVRKVERGDKQTSSKDNGGRGRHQNGKRGGNAPPTGGCIKCKGEHWLSNCPTATEDEKKELLRQIHERRDLKKGKRAGHEA